MIETYYNLSSVQYGLATATGTNKLYSPDQYESWLDYCLQGDQISGSRADFVTTDNSGTPMPVSGLIAWNTAADPYVLTLTSGTAEKTLS